MTEPDREIPPGHTKPPIRNPGLPKDATRGWGFANPRTFPREAKWVLALSAALSFVIILMGDENLGGVTLVALIMVGAFGEAMRPWREAREAGKTPDLLPSIYDRAMSNVFWVGLAMIPVILFSAWLRRVTGMDGMGPT